MTDLNPALTADKSISAIAGKHNVDSEEHTLSLAGLANFSRKNMLAPFVNELAAPLNAVGNAVNAASDAATWTVDKVSRKDYSAPHLGSIVELDVPVAAPGSAASIAQTVSSTVGVAIDYVVAGKIAGRGLRSAGELAPIELEIQGAKVGESIRGVAQDVRVANVVGATAFAGARDTKDGESHISNALSTMVGFGVFEAGNSALVPSQGGMLGKLGARFVVGNIGGAAQAEVASIVHDNKFADLETVRTAGVSGGLLNSLLPAGRSALDHVVEHPVVGGLPHMTEATARLHNDALSSLPTGSAVKPASWADPAFIKTVNEAARSDLHTKFKIDNLPTHITHDDNVVHYSPGDEPLSVLQELAHRKIFRDPASEAQFVEHASKLVSNDPSDAGNASAKSGYVETRLNQEVEARTAQNDAATRLGSPLRIPVDRDVLLKEEGYAAKFERESDEFVRSGGASRPLLDDANAFRHETKFTGDAVEHTFRNQKVLGSRENCFLQTDDIKVFFGYGNDGKLTVGFRGGEGFSFPMHQPIRDIRVLSRANGVHEYFLNGEQTTPQLVVDGRTNKVEVNFPNGDKLVSGGVGYDGWTTTRNGVTYEVLKDGTMTVKINGLVKHIEALGADAEKMMLIEQSDGSRSLQTVDIFGIKRKEITFKVPTVKGN